MKTRKTRSTKPNYSLNKFTMKKKFLPKCLKAKTLKIIIIIIILTIIYIYIY